MSALCASSICSRSVSTSRTSVCSIWHSATISKDTTSGESSAACSAALFGDALGGIAITAWRIRLTESFAASAFASAGDGRLRARPPGPEKDMVVLSSRPADVSANF